MYQTVSKGTANEYTTKIQYAPSYVKGALDGQLLGANTYDLKEEERNTKPESCRGEGEIGV